MDKKAITGKFMKKKALTAGNSPLSNIEHLGSRFNNDHVRTRFPNVFCRFLQIQ